MGAAIGQSLPVAVGVLVSPLPIVAVVLMLVSRRAGANASAFVVGWFVVVGVVVLAVALLAGGAQKVGEPAAWTGWLKIGLGALLLMVAVRQWRGRPRGTEDPKTPGWMGAIDRFTPVRSAGLAALLGAVNPKNLLLVVSGGAAIATAAPDDAESAVVAAIVFAVVASAGVAAPLVIYLAMGERASTLLDDLKAWMIRHNSVIMAVLLLVIGTKMIGDGISVL